MATASRALDVAPGKGLESTGDYFVVVYPSPTLGHGRGANKPWLQELPDPVSKICWQSWVEIHPLTAQQQANRLAMFGCFPSQAQVFRRFPLKYERWRTAPMYDFLEPPHAGTLYYETRDLGFTWIEWQTLARQFLLDC